MNDLDLSSDVQSPRIYTVSALTEEIRDLLEEHFDFVWVEGEISNFRNPASGHYYMVLKDETAQIRAVMFRPQARYLKFVPEDGIKVIAQGRIGVYQPRGEYQIILDYLEPLGVGALALAFEQLKKKLASEGIFDDEAKRPLPYLPQRVAVITSPTGAAIRDFLRVIHRRFANIEIIVVPVKVQGDEATTEMVEALEIVNRELKVDVVVITRGGGSLEDLWAFNREELAYAIRASRIPVVTAVGHEIDITISDLTADFRAPTPSAAAELLVKEKESLELRLNDFRGRLQSGIQHYLSRMKQELAFLRRGIRDPRKRLADIWLRLDELSARLLRLIEGIIGEKKGRLGSEVRTLILQSPLRKIESYQERIAFHKRSLALAAYRRLKDYRKDIALLEGKIKDLSPLSVLERGYSITRKLPERRILRGSAGVEPGDQVHITLAKGELECLVEKPIRK